MTSFETPTMAQLLATFAGEGRLHWIGLRPGRRETVASVPSAQLLAGRGIAGDRSASRRGGRRQVTLLQQEHLAAIASLCGREQVEPALLRRNLLVSGINLLALKGVRFRLGDALLEGTGACHPCSRMEEVLGIGGYNAVRGHGGITAVVVEGGRISVGDSLCAPAR